MEEGKFYLEDKFSKKDIKAFMNNVENLYFTVEENYPIEDIKFWLEGVCDMKRRIDEVV